MPNQDIRVPYDLLGGSDAVRQMVDRFYQLMDQDRRFAAVRALHEMDLSRARQSLFEFLSGWLGGPPLYFERPGHRCVMSAHARFPIGLNEASQWLGCMNQAMVDCRVEEDLRHRLNTAFAAMASGMRNRP